ncbi:MAG: hypothetical protein U5N55_12015 [Cypionkella sp.]|nr:hypothetical protein [Cypionkella sp.]
MRADLVIAGITCWAALVPDAYIPTAEWDAEMLVGAPGLVLTAEITAPQEVDKLIAEFGFLGLSVFWNANGPKVGLKTNRPIFDDVTWEITDNDIVKGGLEMKARDDRRLTEVLFQTVQIDATKGTADDNFVRYEYTIDGNAKDPNAYGDSRLKIEKIRWFNDGNDALIRTLSIRYLRRFSTAPRLVTVTVQRAKYGAASLADVVFITSKRITDADGLPERQAYQIISKQTAGPALVELVLQRYLYDGRYARFLRDTDPNDYLLADEATRARGFYFVSKANPVLPDGSGPYLFA